MLRLGFLKTRCWRLACHTGCTNLTEHILARLYWHMWYLRQSAASRRGPRQLLGCQVRWLHSCIG